MLRFPFLLASFFFFIIGLRSQVIVITFEGTVNGTPTPLDSIRVMNLTQGGDTTIYFPDQELVLGATGIGEERSPGRAMQGLPNPFAGSTDVVVHSIGGVCLITLHDVAGRALLSQAANLAAGTQRIRVSCERPGVHLLTVLQGGVRSALRLMATEDAGVAGLSLVGGSDRGAPKADRSLFTWVPGEELRYIGYATSEGVLHSAAIDEVPDASATRTFEMASGAVCPDAPSATDIDGNVYASVQISDQCWMAANLKTTRYRDGSIIPNVTDNTAWYQLNNGAWCNYDNIPANDDTFGKLYNGYAAANTNVCPQGWHVPSDAEWQQMELALGMPAGELEITANRGTAQNVGGKMKATILWNAPNIGATNESGLSGLPGGYRYSFDDGNFYELGLSGTWWSVSGSEPPGDAWCRGVTFLGAGVYRIQVGSRNGYYLRCVRD